MNKQNQMYKLFAEMKEGYKTGNDTLIDHGARCWLDLGPENPFQPGTPEHEEFFQMESCYFVWKRGDISRKIHQRMMLEHAKALCKLNPRQPYKFDKTADAADKKAAEEAEKRREEEIIKKEAEERLKKQEAEAAIEQRKKEEQSARQASKIAEQEKEKKIIEEMARQESTKQETERFEKSENVVKPNPPEIILGVPEKTSFANRLKHLFKKE